MRLIRSGLQQSLLLNLITIMVVGMGIGKAFQMQREAFPAVNYDLLTIRTSYPGASPKEVELYVTNSIERELAYVSGVAEYNSSSIEGFSLILIKLDPDQSETQKTKTVDDIQRAVERVNDLPEDLPNPPQVKEADSRDFPIIELTISGPSEYKRLHEITDGILDRLEDIDGLAAINKRGFRDREFWVQADPEKMRRYKISFQNLIHALQVRNLNLPGGSIETDEGEFLVRTLGEVRTPEEISNVVVRTNDSGVTIRVKDLATVTEEFADEKIRYHTNGKPSINLLILKSFTGDIISLVDRIKSDVDQYLRSIDAKDVNVTFVNDMSSFVRNRLGVLMNNGIVGVLLVLATLLIFLSKGIAVVTAIGMPVAFMGALAVMGYFGMTINLITMFAMVIVLGMLVDDAIIVAENIWHHYERGEPPLEAAIKGTSEVFWPVTATILTTISAFSPLLMIEGIFGKFIQHMPLVVIFALLMSLLEAMFVLPSHSLDFLLWRHKRKGKAVDTPESAPIENRRSKWIQEVTDRYGLILKFVLNKRYYFLLGTCFTLAFSIWFALVKMPMILFPSEGIEAFFIRGKMQVGDSLNETTERFRALEAVVSKLPDFELQDYVTTIGMQQDDPNDPFTQRASHIGQITVYLTPEMNRDRTASEIIEAIRKPIADAARIESIEGISFTKLKQGPPVGKPVAIRVNGDNLTELTAISENVKQRLKTLEGVSDVTSNYNRGKEELNVLVYEKAAARSLLSVRDIALHVRTAYEGFVATYVRSTSERVAIRVRHPQSERNKSQSLSELEIPNAASNLIKLTDVARLERSEGINAIFHRDGKRSITVTADVNEEVTTSEWVNENMEVYLQKIRSKHPNVTLTAGGEWEDTEKSMRSMFESFSVALALVYLILATQFRNLFQPLVVMAAIPFGIIGVIWAFFAHGLPISFLGLVGTIGLTGVIVNDSIVLVDFLNKARMKGMNAFDAALYAGKRRFRAVWLTTLTTVFGLLPLVYGIGGMDRFLQPAAVALGYGLIFGTVLVLLLIPALYLILVDALSKIGWDKPMDKLSLRDTN